MRTGFNTRFMLQLGDPELDPMKPAVAQQLIHSKDIKQLKRYHEQVYAAARKRENSFFHLRMSPTPMPHPEQVPGQAAILTASPGKSHLARGRGS